MYIFLFFLGKFLFLFYKKLNVLQLKYKKGENHTVTCLTHSSLNFPFFSVFVENFKYLNELDLLYHYFSPAPNLKNVYIIFNTWVGFYNIFISMEKCRCILRLRTQLFIKQSVNFMEFIFFYRRDEIAQKDYVSEIFFSNNINKAHLNVIYLKKIFPFQFISFIFILCFSYISTFSIYVKRIKLHFIQFYFNTFLISYRLANHSNALHIYLL